MGTGGQSLRRCAPGLAAARSPRGSDMPPACHSLPRGRFATLAQGSQGTDCHVGLMPSSQ
nr:MAG TPA: hypothetical protein [Bacteriophage sp.]